VFTRIEGKQRYLWRAVDQDGEVLDILVQTHRTAQAAKRFFRKLLKCTGVSPRVVVTDKLRSHGAAHRGLGIGARHETGRYRNNHAENSHQPTRRRERHINGFKSIAPAQHLLAAHAPITDLFRHGLTASCASRATECGATLPKLRPQRDGSRPPERLWPSARLDFSNLIVPFWQMERESLAPRLKAFYRSR